jgi:2-amino-4-hydroxy-6-hydroxymethyldihydropteridine diphosphokinase
MNTKTTQAVIALSTNIENKNQNLLESIDLVSDESANTIFQKSPIYITAAWGLENQPDYLNQVIEIQTKFTAEELLDFLQSVETKLKRVRTIKFGPRTIDLDILFYGQTILDSKNLAIPHPLLQERNFVLAPLNDILPNLIHPVLNKTINQLFQECTDTKAFQLQP